MVVVVGEEGVGGDMLLLHRKGGDDVGDDEGERTGSGRGSGSVREWRGEHSLSTGRRYHGAEGR